MAELTALQQAVKEAYGLPIDSWIVVEERDGIHKLCSGGKAFALKKNKYPLAEFAYIYSAVLHLLNRGFTNINYMLLTKEQQPLAECQGESYFLAPWLAGRAADYQKERDVILAAQGVARFHQATFGFVPAVYDGRMKWGCGLQMLQSKQQDLQQWRQWGYRKSNPGFFDFLYRKHVENHCRELGEVLAELLPYYGTANQFACARGGFCHHDLAYHNLVLLEGQPTALGLIDFDYCISDLTVHDVASFLLRILKANGWRPRLALTALAAYEAVQPLRYDEKRVMLGLMKMPQQFWQLGLAYYVELEQMEDTDSRRQRLNKLENRLVHFLDSKQAKAAALAKLAAEVEQSGGR